MIPIISVIVPIYNAEKYITDCIESILNQTISEIEIILVNDGSTDDSLSLCADLAEKDRRILLISQENSGVSVARNSGKSMATGDYIIFVDADDEMLPDMLETLLNNIKATDADISVCNIQKCRSRANIVKEFENSELEILTKEDAISYLLLEKKLYFGPWNKLYKREVIENVEFIRGRRMNEDKYFVFQALHNAEKIVYVDKPLYCYFIRENSAATAKFSDRWFDIVYFAKEIYYDVCVNFPKLEKQARFSMVKTLYFLAKKMNKAKVLKAYDAEYKKLLKDIKNTKIRDIFSMFQNSTKVGLIMLRLFPKIFEKISQ